jgi:hypothetical protein
MTIEKTGWQKGMSDKEYFDTPGISFSDMSLCLRGALPYRNRKEFPLDSPTLQFGSDFHELMLFDRFPKKITAANKKHLEAMHSQLKRVELFKKVMSLPDVAIEIPGFYEGHKCKPDIRVPSLGLLIDLKTTTDASPEAFKWSAKKFNYHLQAAHYLDVSNSIDGKNYKTFLFVAVEKSSPYNIYIHECSDRVLARGKELKEQAVFLLDSYHDKEILEQFANEDQNQINLLDF